MTVVDTTLETFEEVDIAKAIPCDFASIGQLKVMHKQFGTGDATKRVGLKCPTPTCKGEDIAMICAGCLEALYAYVLVCLPEVGGCGYMGPGSDHIRWVQDL